MMKETAPTVSHNSVFSKEGVVLSKFQGSLQDSIKELIASIGTKDAKRQGILAEWIHVWSVYLKQETSFDPSRFVPLKRGMIVYLHMGFNIGSETGGVRYAVVVENNNNPKSGTVVVVPLSSLSHGKTRESLHDSEVYLGNVVPWDSNGTESYAKVMQIRAVSKLRIIHPKSKTRSKAPAKITSAQMDVIDEKIRKYFTKTLDKRETT